MLEQSRIICEPPRLVFHDLPAFSEQSLVLESTTDVLPGVILWTAQGERHTFSMVPDGLNRFRVSFRLMHGRYNYLFRLEGKDILDRTNAGPLASVNGKIVNTLHVPDLSEELRVTCKGPEDLAVTVSATPKVLDVRPQHLTVGPGNDAHITVWPLVQNLAPGTVVASVELREPRTDKLLASCPVEMRVRGVSPRLMVSVRPERTESETLGLELTKVGPGRLRCHVLERFSPSVSSVEFDESEHVQCWFKRVHVSDGLRAVLGHLPAGKDLVG